MPKFYGPVGYAEPREGTGDHEGIVEDVMVEHFYYGDVLRNTRKWESGSDILNNLRINNQISIVADAYAYEHFFTIKYVKYMGAYWEVTNVEPLRPRLLLTIGGVYNGPTAGSASSPSDDVCCCDRDQQQ